MESIDVEIELKLTELKIVGNHYNDVELAMRYASGEQWHTLNQERNVLGARYQVLCDWFWERNLKVRWDKAERCYKIMPHLG
jgi:hypothetical protein